MLAWNNPLNLLLKRTIALLLFVGLSSFCLADDIERQKTEFVYDLSLATQGVMVSQYNTGVNYSLGIGIHVDLEKGVFWFQEATKQGHSKAPFNLAILYAKGGDKIMKDLILSETYFLLAAERGNKEAKNFMAKVYASKLKNSSDAIEKLCCPPLVLHATALPFSE